jgi:hypothetical protein
MISIIYFKKSIKINKYQINQSDFYIHIFIIQMLTSNKFSK